VVLVDPLPGTAVEVVGHVGAVGDVEHDLARRAQQLADCGQNLLVVLLVGKVSERVAHDGDAVERTLVEARVASVAFLEDDLQAFVLRTLFGESDQIAGAVDARDIAEATAGELEAVAALAAAEIQDAAVRLDRLRTLVRWTGQSVDSAPPA